MKKRRQKPKWAQRQHEEEKEDGKDIEEDMEGVRMAQGESEKRRLHWGAVGCVTGPFTPI